MRANASTLTYSNKKTFLSSTAKIKIYSFNFPFLSFFSFFFLDKRKLKEQNLGLAEEFGGKNFALLFQVLDDLNAHGISGADDGFADGRQGHVLAIRVGLLDLGDLVNVLQRQSAHRNVSRPAAAGLDPGGLLQVPGDGRRLDGELEGVILEGRDGHRHGSVWLVLLRPSVEVLAEGH